MALPYMASALTTGGWDTGLVQLSLPPQTWLRGACRGPCPSRVPGRCLCRGRGSRPCCWEPAALAVPSGNCPQAQEMWHPRCPLLTGGQVSTRSDSEGRPGSRAPGRLDESLVYPGVHRSFCPVSARASQGTQSKTTCSTHLEGAFVSQKTRIGLLQVPLAQGAVVTKRNNQRL